MTTVSDRPSRAELARSLQGGGAYARPLLAALPDGEGEIIKGLFRAEMGDKIRLTAHSWMQCDNIP